MNLEKIISWTLRIGVILSAMLVVAGSITYFLERSTNQAPSSNFSVLLVFQDLLRGNPIALILLGVIVLVATPIARVLELVISYGWEKDRTYTLLSFLVLALMLVGIVLVPRVVPILR
jgi:uncharacterized membrane protein